MSHERTQQEIEEMETARDCRSDDYAAGYRAGQERMRERMAQKFDSTTYRWLAPKIRELAIEDPPQDSPESRNA